MGSQTFQRLSQQSLEEHQQIHFYLDQLTRALQALAEPADAEPIRRLAAQIESVRERIDEHFQLEEHGGLFQAVLDLLPGADPEVRRLTAQHVRIVHLLEAARIRARASNVGEVGALRDELDRFLQAMRQHEREEEALLRRALREDEAT
jgi:hemerythrin-like domain-containing protein